MEIISPNKTKFFEETRNSSLDFLKIVLVSLVIISHSALPYFIGPNGVWYVHSQSFNYDFFEPWFFSINAFIINTFFFIAGFLSYYSIEKHDIVPFLKSRIRRIFIPLLLGFLFILPPLQYYSYLEYEPVKHVGFIDYLISYWYGFKLEPNGWVGHYPDMNLGHLWFLEHLIIYSFLFALFFYALRRFSITIKMQFYVFLTFILLLTILVTYIMKYYHPVTEMSAFLGFIQVDYTHVLQNCILFFSGIYFAKMNYMRQIRHFTKKFFFLIGLFLVFLPFLVFYIFPSSDYLFYNLTFFSMWESLTAVFFSIGSITYLDTVFRIQSKTLVFLGESSYGIYVFHVIFVVFFQIILEYFAIDPISKFIIVSICSLVLSFGFVIVQKILVQYYHKLTNKVIPNI